MSDAKNNMSLSLLLLGSCLGGQTFAAAGDQIKPWTLPGWSFEPIEQVAEVDVQSTVRKLSAKSLFFDQAFDKQSLRTFPGAPASGETSVIVAQVAASVPEKAPVQIPEPIVIAEVSAELAPPLVSLRGIPEPEAQPLPQAAELFPEDLLDSLTLNRSLYQRNSIVEAVEAARNMQDSMFDKFMATRGEAQLVVEAPVQTSVSIPSTEKPVGDAASAVPSTLPSPTPGPTPVVVVNRTLHNGDRKAAPVNKNAGVRVYSGDSLEESLALRTVEGAEITWIGMGSKLVRKTDLSGWAPAPYGKALSMRFLVRAPGYLPALGYSIRGQMSTVMLFSEQRMAPVLQSLGVIPDPAKVLLFGKIIDKNLKPVAKAVVDASVSDPFKVFYSLGSLGLFHKKATETGELGEFFVSGMSSGIQYLMPGVLESQGSLKEWPAAIVDLNNVGPIVTTTIQESSTTQISSMVVDAFSLERPEGVAISVTIGGQRGVYIPDNEGSLKIPDVHQRNTVDLFELRAQGYLKTWVSSIPDSRAFPGMISLFTQSQLDSIFSSVNSEQVADRPFVFGHLASEKFNRAIVAMVFDSRGARAKDARVYYFDQQNRLQADMKATDRIIQNFAIAGLSPGEWHVIVADASSLKAVDAQVVRVEQDAVSQIEFQ